jgi:kynurenine formamidase
MGIYENNREFSRETLQIVMHIGTHFNIGKSFANNISYGTKTCMIMNMEGAYMYQ